MKYILKEYYQNLERNLLKDIQVTSILIKSKNSLDIRWLEKTLDNAGKIINSQNFIANLEYQYGQISENNLVLKHNPLGFYINRIVWSEDCHA